MARRRTFIGPMPRGMGGVGRQYDVWPLDRLPLWHQFDIACDAQGDSPPAKWFRGDLFEMPSRGWHEWHWQRGVDPNAKRPPISPTLRASVYERDGRACLFCGATESLSLDHIHPYSLGGPDTFDNLQTLCRSCNSRKGARV